MKEKLAFIKKSLASLKQKIKAQFFSKVFILRLFITILLLDFIAFMSLSSLSPFELLNPFHFLKIKPQEERTYITLYLPSSLSLQEENLLEVQEKALQLPVRDSEDSEKIIFNARQILTQLELGAQNLKTRRIFQSQNNFLFLWHYQRGLVVKVNHENWKKMTAREQELAREAIVKTLMANLPLSYVHLDFSP